MKNFQVIEKVEMSRVWEAPATTAYAALDMFREGRARFMNDVPARPRPLVSVTVVDPDTQADFTERQLDKEMADMVGPAIDTPEGLEEALALEPGSLVEALTMPPGKAATNSEDSAAHGGYLQALEPVFAKYINAAEKRPGNEKAPYHAITDHLREFRDEILTVLRAQSL